MLQALLASVASVKAQQTRINVIGNNLANVNTVGYKASRVTFQDMLSQTVQGAKRPTAAIGGSNPLQFGLGVVVAGTANNEVQGSLSSTNRNTDLAIQGGGYFLVSNGERVAYTRDGAFDFDANGNLVQRGTGERLLGWSANGSGIVDTTTPITTASSLQVPIGQLSAVRETQNASYAGNFSASSVAADTWTSSIQIFDSLGAAHTIDAVFTNLQKPPLGVPPAGAVASLDWSASEGGTALSDFASAGNTRLYFDSTGNMITGGAIPATQTLALTPSNGANVMSVALDFTKISSLATDTQITPKDQDGFPPGSLSGFNIDSGGGITGIFTNGLTRSLGQIALAIFPNAAGLEKIGSNLARETDNSGIPIYGTPGTKGRGSVNAGFLEESNVDIGTEFTELIVTQRGFQANTKVVTTVDEMLQDLLNIKR